MYGFDDISLIPVYTIEQTSSWLKLAYWSPARGSNVGLGLGS